jgi:hypothetical protein
MATSMELPDGWDQPVGQGFDGFIEVIKHS